MVPQRAQIKRRPLRAAGIDLLFCCLTASMAVFSTVPSAHAGSLAFAEATSELHDGKPKSYVYNAIDGKERTIWCSQENPGKEMLTIGFKKAVKISSFSIQLARRGDDVDDSKAWPSEIALSDGTSVFNITVRHKADVQTVKINPPLRGDRLMLSLEELRGAGDGNAVCIGEIELKSGSRKLTGSVVHRKLRGINTPSRRLLHSWIDSVDVLERTLVFNLDGTFIYRYSPALEGSPKTIKGKWRTSGRNRIAMTTRGKTYRIKKELNVDDGTLMLDGAKLHPSLENVTLQLAPDYP